MGWQLPSPAARFLCAAVIYTRSRSRASLHRHEDTTRRYYWRPELELLCTVWGRGGVRVGLLARAVKPSWEWAAEGSHDHASDLRASACTRDRLRPAHQRTCAAWQRQPLCESTVYS